MSGELKKIDYIKNMAVFQDFKWAASVRDKGNNVAEFKKLNIFYGRNYSGKTTLSRILRAMETGCMSDKYYSPEFQMNFEDGATITQNKLTGHGKVIRVFNEDFVRENLRFIIDDEHTINSFAILGEDNAKLEDKIKQFETELGSDEDKSGLRGKALEAIDALSAAKKRYDDQSSGLGKKLCEKANKTGSGIKHNKLFGNANYNVTSIKTDIKSVSRDSYRPLSSDQIDNCYELLKEEPKRTIPESRPFNLNFSSLLIQAKELIEKKIQTSDPIQDLLNEAVLETWVRNGRMHHEGKRTTCAFCGNVLPQDLWEKLDKHFNKESEELRQNIKQLLLSITTEKERTSKLLQAKASDFYSNFSSGIEQLIEQFDKQYTSYGVSLDSLKIQLGERENDIFNPRTFVAPDSAEKEFSEIRGAYEDLRNQSNQFTDSLSTKQTEAKNALRLHEVFTFINDIQYSDECKYIEELNVSLGKAEQNKIIAETTVKEKRTQITALKAQLKDESKGADRVNDYLNNFFGHQSISLKAIKNKAEGTQTGYRFEITRNNKKAFHLSEGECSLIAFCYFMAKLEDVETKGSQPLIWIDDPISSLDTNHIFFVYSLINSEIVALDKAKQLFISTHNLDFLKYLKRLPGALNNKKAQYFIINRSGHESNITIMPKYLKDYVTEFNFLFHQLYKCANAQIGCDENHDCYYNFGNNVRKFLEAFLYYKYPNAKDNDDKLARFFGDDALAVSLTDRINNEYSHLAGIFERSILPIDVPEMKTSANFILQKIEEKDPDQYEALLQSIGVTS